jgi:hypothetical protein
MVQKQGARPKLIWAHLISWSDGVDNLGTYRFRNSKIKSRHRAQQSDSVPRGDSVLWRAEVTARRNSRRCSTTRRPAEGRERMTNKVYLVQYAMEPETACIAKVS